VPPIPPQTYPLRGELSAAFVEEVLSIGGIPTDIEAAFRLGGSVRRGAVIERYRGCGIGRKSGMWGESRFRIVPRASERWEPVDVTGAVAVVWRKFRWTSVESVHAMVHEICLDLGWLHRVRR
jgi:hypothetical protein